MFPIILRLFLNVLVLSVFTVIFCLKPVLECVVCLFQLCRLCPVTRLKPFSSGMVFLVCLSNCFPSAFRTGKMRVPDCMDLIKSARFKELAPYDADWFYIRSAALLRHIYIRSPVGVGAVTKIFGGRVYVYVHHYRYSIVNEFEF